MRMSQLVQFTKQDGVATVTIDNPPMNVLSTRVAQAIKDVFLQIKEDPEVIAVILTGNGDRAFMAGADIKEFPSWIQLGKEEVRKIAKANHEVLNLIEEIQQPTIAMLNGFTFGGGCELALACDIRIAEEHAKLGLPEVNLGLFPGAGGTQRLPKLVGLAKAKEIMFLGEAISANESLSIGLVNKVVPKGEGMAAAKSMAQKIAGQSLQALSRIKKAVNEGADQSLESALELELNLFVDIFSTEDVREGVQAFIEKRPAKFTHK
ncbi:enoyl-CoA hydratase/isomerase family protein [Neobacillus niacini]|uniref:enoyl-CoA hydratase/isomerase family protein n=1 Tax=Neobacillus niacini TaxID=86668 RepID=UPI0037C83E1A